MSYFRCPNCESKHYIFGQGGARRTGQEMGLDFLAELPISQRLQEASDAGTRVLLLLLLLLLLVAQLSCVQASWLTRSLAGMQVHL